MSLNLRTLVLHQNFMPISVFPKLYTIPVEDAIVRYLDGSCEVVYWYDRHVLTPSRSDLRWPSVIANKNTGKLKTNVQLKKSTLYYRDHARCAYCSKDLDINEITTDHVMPKVRGGKHAWSNVVLSCKDCNSRKGDALPQGKWQPKHKPYEPSFFDLMEKRKKFPVIIDDENWAQFLPGFVNLVTRGEFVTDEKGKQRFKSG